MNTSTTMSPQELISKIRYPADQGVPQSEKLQKLLKSTCCWVKKILVQSDFSFLLEEGNGRCFKKNGRCFKKHVQRVSKFPTRLMDTWLFKNFFLMETPK